ncbi:MAG: tRNA (adenosine(37)-N6)-dimethylallyltransferase MiaA [Deltaproteobacteria bacterium]|nr:tRNA (adenosine(37)-N6)-dimethylallyltransferase MiaA [Deltaproteobacteria bacterium]
MNPPRPLLLVIVGPTASGKTAVVHTLADEEPGSIINADSMQVYRHMDIGTAKPSLQERKTLPYHLIDVVNPDEPFNAAIFLDMARKVIAGRRMDDRPVYVAGGTGLYVRILLGGLITGPGPDDALRKQYKNMIAQFGKGYLHDLLRQRDPQAAGQINPNDAVRMIRALEVLDLTGESIIKKQTEHAFQANREYRYLKIGIRQERERLRQRIERRADEMIEAGLLHEVESLLAMNYGEDLKAMQSLGYRHMVRHLKGDCTLEDAVAEMKRDTWKYAKRQMTWFKRDKEILWFDPDRLSEIRRRISTFSSG